MADQQTDTHMHLLRVPADCVEWAVQRDDDPPVPIEGFRGRDAEEVARRLCAVLGKDAAHAPGGYVWRVVMRVTTTPWVQR